MAEVNLSKAVRSNLLSLQSTASAMASTQGRLATGLKVNSALDNPSNFFTAAALNSRAGDMSNLLDSMSSGIKTIEAADNGLKSITRTVESMQSTLRQARQDKSFKSQSFSVDAAAMGLLEFSGGALASTQGVSLGTGGAVAAAVSASADYVSPAGTAGKVTFAYSPDTSVWTGADSLLLQVDRDGASSAPALLQADVLAVGNNDAIIDDIDEFTDALNVSFTGLGIGVTASNDGSNVTIASDTLGVTSSFAVTSVISGLPGNVNSTFGMTIDPGSTGAAGTNKSISISNGTATANITLTSLNAATVGTARSYIQSELAAQGVTGITVGGSGNRIDLTGAADGSNDISVGGADADDVFGAAPGITAGATAGSLSVDQLITAINSNSALEGKVRATNDNGRLRIENLATEDLTMHGVGTDGEIDGSLGTSTLGGNDVRKNLVKQFNDLRDQLDKFSDDASFNGINLLRGDKMKLTFNETGTSAIDIQAEDALGSATNISNASLGIDEASLASFDSDAEVDASLDKLKTVLDKLRSQSSSFGSNLSIVENRTDFTKNMINTLETGAANLTLADTNEEAANLLALQTRQQLSSTALSMASQADQAVLRLF